MEIEISKENSDYMYNIIEKIIDECGPRMPGSPQEAKAAEIIKKELAQTCDEVVIEPFTFHPRANLGWIKIALILTLLSFSLFFLIKLFLESYWSLILATFLLLFTFIPVLLLWEEFLNYKEFIDPLFKKGESQNVIGKIKSQEEVKKIIIFSGHHDSALQFNLLKYLKLGYVIVILLGIGILILWFLISIAFFIFSLFIFLIDFTIIYGFFFNIAIWLLIIGAIPILLLFFFVSPGEKANKVPGAVDNLSAVSVVLGLGRYLKNHKEIIPKNMEIRLASWGSEEAFLRGAFRYVEAHLEELKKCDTVCVNMDALQQADNIMITEKEPTTRTVFSEEVVQNLIDAANLVNLKVKKSSLGGSSFLEKLYGQISGGTDAAAFAKAGIKASTITSLSLLTIAKFYHQDTDTLDKIEKGTLENVLKLLVGYLLNESKIKK
jgi:aminopeptidase YwaD